MPDTDWENLKEIFHAAVVMPPEGRAAYLDKACGGDPSLRAAVESLLKSHEETGNSVDAPAYQEAEMLIDGLGFKPGDIVAHYKILSLLGEGGMGKVYLAQDTKLDRKVALKFLPADLAATQEHLRRFIHEARSAAALNHPNIAQIFEIGKHGRADYIAMEYVEGETLRQLLARPKLDIKRVVELAAQVASGLSAAHQEGVIHRDIKPENLIVTANGRIKILDFGLAKLVEKQKGAAGVSELTTAYIPSTSRAETMAGAILGTVSYMSPEQARAEKLDQRTDIFSLGVVLYEMITRERPFGGKSTIDTLHAIINHEPPPVTQLNSQTPPEVADILAKALAKDLSERYQHAGDFELDLRRFKRALESNTLISTRVERPVIPEVKRRRIPSVTALIVGALIVLGVATAAWILGRATATPKSAVALELVTLTPLTTDPGYEGEPTFSPDGQTIAYVSDRSGNFEIYIQQISGGSYRNITENKADDVQPAYSPDGQQIAFVSSRSSSSNLHYDGYDLPFMGGDIWVMPALGGNAMRVAQSGNFPSWSRDGSAIIYTAGPSFGQKIYRVDAKGGESREIVPKLKPDPRFLLYPSYSADERWIAFEADTGGVGGFGQRDIAVMRSDTGEVQHIAKGQHPSWSADSGAIIYSSGEPGKNFSLWQIPFSSAQGKVSGPSEPLTVSRGRDAQAAISRDGQEIAFAGIETSFNVETLPFDAEAGRPSGSPEEITNGRKVSYFQSYSPDGKTVVFESRQGSGSHLWKTELGAAPVQLTADPNFDEIYPRWSPVDHMIAFNRRPVKEPQSLFGLWLMTDDGANPRLVAEKAGNFTWMPDGRALVYFSLADLQLYLLDVATKSARRLTNEPKIAQLSAASPDGKWVIYQTLQAGNIDLCAIPVEGGEPRNVVETLHQDYHPFVSPSGKWLYFLLDHKNIYRVPGPAQDWRKAEPEQVTKFPESGLFLEDPQISLDGKKLLYSHGRITGDIWILVLDGEASD